MDANTKTPKSAASSKPAAQPSGSQPDVEKPAVAAAQAAGADLGTDAEQVTESDILSALGQLSDDPKTEQPAKPTKVEEPEEPIPAVEEPQQPEEEVPGESGELGDTPAASGDDAGTTPSESDNSETPPEEPAAGDDPKKVSAAQQRINELTARAKASEEAHAKDRERLASFEAASSGRLDAGVLDHVDTIEGLAQHRQQVVALHQKLLKSPQGIDLPDPNQKGSVIHYDAEGVADLLGQTFMLVHEAIPSREQFLKSRGEADAAAVNAYPWIKDTRQGQGAQVQAAIEKNPGLRRIGPNYKLVAADALIGQTLREAGVSVTPQLIAKLKQESSKPVRTTATPAVARKAPPPAPARAGVIPPRTTPRTAQTSAADKRLRAGNGNVNDLTASIAARFA